MANAPPINPQAQQNYFARNHKNRSLPPPHELYSRIEEAKTSASLLSQVVQSTSPSELLSNELVREFADRCQSASRSIQAYMIAENPSPDNATMETLIETNEQLSKAMNQHQRAILNARKFMGIGNGEVQPPPEMTPARRTESGFAAPPPGPPPSHSKPVVRKQAPVPPPGDFAPTGSDDEENPFSDPRENRSHNPAFLRDQPSSSTGQFNDHVGIEPYHPGFKETQSHVGRQDTLTDRTPMRTAESETIELPADEEREGYGASVGAKAPVYRY